MLAENLLLKIKEHDPAPFEWLNPSRYVLLPGGGIRVTAPAKCDYFRDPAGSVTADSAPFLHVKTTGDFVMKALVSHPFRTKWDAAALMIRQDASHWAKICYEGTDFGTHAVVSVVTNGVSDDANGVNYTWPVVWLQMVRKGNVFCVHYGPDGERWNMVRYFSLNVTDELMAGMVAQCPAGAGAEMDFLHFSLEKRTVDDVRAGV